jgi:hypothetical protein
MLYSHDAAVDGSETDKHKVNSWLRSAASVRRIPRSRLERGRVWGKAAAELEVLRTTAHFGYHHNSSLNGPVSTRRAGRRSHGTHVGREACGAYMHAAGSGVVECKQPRAEGASV